MSSEHEQEYIGCVDWGEEIVLSVRRTCVECSRDVALAAHNINAVAERKMKPICLRCVKKIVAGDWEYGGGLIAGRVISPAETGITKERVEQHFNKENRDGAERG